MDPATKRSEWDPAWTGDEILESTVELADVERLVSDVEPLMGEAAGDAPPQPEGSDVELVARLEGRDEGEEGEEAVAEPEPSARADAPEDVETYAVAPELDLLLGLAEYGGRPDEEPDEAGEVLWFDVVVA